MLKNGVHFILKFNTMSFYLIPLGIIYDVIVEPPSIGSTTDERGNSKPVSIIWINSSGKVAISKASHATQDNLRCS